MDDNDQNHAKLLVLARQKKWDELVSYFNDDIDYGAVDSVKMPWGDNVIFIAISQCDDIEKLKKLVLSYNNVFYSNNDGENQLHIAVRRRALEVVKIVSSHVGNTPLAMKNNDGETPVFVSGYVGSFDSFQYLFAELLKESERLRHQDPNYLENCLVRKDGNSIIHVSIKHGFTDIALEVIKTFPNLMKKKNKEGLTALHVLASHPASFKSGYAARCMWGKYCRCSGVSDQLLIKKNEISLEVARELIKANSKDFDSFAPLDSRIMRYVSPSGGMPESVIVSAVKSGIVELVKLILDEYPTEIGRRDIRNFNIFFLAVESRQLSVLHFLIETSCFEHLLTEIKDEETILHIAAKFTSDSQFWRDAKYEFILESLCYQKVKRTLKHILPRDKVIEIGIMVNKEKKTPQQVFDESHKKILETGLKWFNEICKSYIVIPLGAMTFAAGTISFVLGVSKKTGDVAGNNVCKENAGVVSVVTKDDVGSGFLEVFVLFSILTFLCGLTSVICFSGVTSCYGDMKSLSCVPKKTFKSFITKMKRSPCQLLFGLMNGILSLVFLSFLFFLGESLGNGNKIFFYFGWASFFPVVLLICILYSLLGDLLNMCRGEIEYFVNKRRGQTLT